jgi:hypothetical protein
MRGSSNVLPIELEAASRRGDNLKTLGTVLSTAGSVVGMGAGAGWWDPKTVADTAGTVASAAPAAAGGTKLGIDYGNLLLRDGPVDIFGNPIGLTARPLTVPAIKPIK